MLLLYGVGAIAGAQASGRFTDRYGSVVVLTVGYLVMATTLLVFGVLTIWSVATFAAVAILAFTWGASSWCQTPPQQHRLIDAAPPEGAPLVIALNSSAIYIGIGLGTTIGGLVGTERPGWMFLSGAILAISSGAVLLVSRRRARAHTHHR